MANAASAEEQSAEQVESPEKDSPLLDLSDAVIKTAKARGYATYDELNAVLPLEEVSSEQIEDTMSMQPANILIAPCWCSVASTPTAIPCARAS